MGGGKGGSADQSGMMEAMISAQAAQMAYNLGEQQLQWAKQVWNADQPLINEVEQTQVDVGKQQIAGMQQAQAFAQEQENVYNQFYLPMEEQYVQQVQNWASPQNVAAVTGQAQSTVAENVNQGIDTARERLSSYGVNPASGPSIGMEKAARVMGAAAEAGAGNTAAQNLKFQQMQLEGQAGQVGQGMVGQTGQLIGVGTQAGSAASGSMGSAAGVANQNLATGSQAFTAPTAWFNTGAANMGVYTNAVANYNNTQLGYAQLGAQQMMGLGQLGGSILGTLMPFGMAAKGGPIVKYQEGGDVQAERGIPMPAGATPRNGLPSGATPGGGVPAGASPSGGVASDDVHALLTAGEFVMPKDVSMWKGHEYFAKEIDKARQAQQEFANRDDIGGEAAQGIPTRPPAFISRPLHTGGARVAPRPQMAQIPQMAQRGIPQRQAA